jgi:hypothetical protein
MPINRQKYLQLPMNGRAFTNDLAANALLGRSMRKEWRVKM